MGAGAALAILILFGVWPLRGGDLWAHLAAGKYTWQYGDVPRVVGVFTYVNADGEFVAHSWGAELIFYGLEQAAGTVGFVWLRLALVSIALWCALRVARMLKAPWPPVILLAPLVLATVWGRLEFRPQLFTTAFLAVELWLLISIHVGARSPRWLWILPPLYILWINLHPGWPQGLAILVGVTGVVAALQARQRWLGTGGTSGLPLRTLALVLGACLLALCLNPYGPRLVWFPLEMQQPWIRELGAEWQSPFGNEGWGFVGGGAWVPIQPIFYGYLALLVGVLMHGLRRWRTADLLPLGLMAFWCAISVWHLRAVSDATLITSPLVAAALGSAWWHRRTWLVPVGVSGLAGLAVVGLWCAWQIDHWQWKRQDPRCLMASLERLALPARVVVAAPRLGYGWLQYHYAPRLRAHHHWEYIIGEAAHAEHLAVTRGEPADLMGFLDTHAVGTIILSNRLTEGYRELEARGWVFLHMDNQHSIMVRRMPETEAFIAREEYRWLRAWISPPPVTEANAGEVLQETWRALRQCPEEATFAWDYQVHALRLLGRHEEARLAARMVPRAIEIE